MAADRTVATVLREEREDEGVRRSLDALTAAERRTLQLFASGLARGEIAQLLNRAPKTISNSLTAAKEKLGARSLAEAAALLVASAAILPTSAAS